MYRERMIGYYPKVIQDIKEFQAIIDGEYPEFEEIKSSNQRVISDAYLTTMSEERIIEWEKLLSIRPIEGSTIEDRRETIIARLRGQGKLNTQTIKNIVSTFTGANCDTWIEDGVLHVHLHPSRNGKEYILENIIQEISMKLPTHLGLIVDKAWQTWNKVDSNYSSWGGVRSVYGTWEDVLFDSQSKANQLNYSTLDSLYLG